MASQVMGSVLGGGTASANTAGQAASQAALTANANKLAELSDTFMQNSNDTLAKAKPLTDLTGRVAADAQNYDSQANQDLVAGRASADVNQSFDKSQQMLDRQLTRQGANPNSGAAIASLRDAQIQRAAVEAGAMTNARTGTIDKAIGLRSAAVGTGLNTTNMANSQAGLAVNALGGSNSAHGASADVGAGINKQNLDVTNTNNALGASGIKMGAQIAGMAAG